MIQRIQSLYLAFTGIISIFAGNVLDLIPDEQVDLVLFTLIGILALTVLFLYKKRKLQKKINYLNIVINVLLISFMVYSLLKSPGGDFSPEKGVGVFVPVLLIILLAMANKHINKDEKLLKSVDRFR